MRDARLPFNGWIKTFKNAKASSEVFDTIQDFDRWIGSRVSVPQNTILLTLSHYTDGKLCFSDPGCIRRSVLSADVIRAFPDPSAAIVIACGTARPGDSEFVQQLNSHGVYAVVATSTAIGPELAGDFLKSLADKLKGNMNDPNYSLNRAEFDAVLELRNKYQDRPLVFSVIGNGALRLCTP